ncbi:MAG: ATP-binding protein [Deltaproteobacteria bacterium]|nr:ATP-binding protein [Deltaproteobacteria bacterium]
MEALPGLYIISLTAAVISSLAMALLLWRKSAEKEALLPLIFFCTAVALWLSGYLLINGGTPPFIETGRFFINLSPLVAAFFLHFVLLFSGKKKKIIVPLLYVIALIASATGILLHAGEIRPWLGFNFYYRANKATAILAVVTLLYSSLGHLILLKESVYADKKRQRQMLALFMSGLWGLLSASGFVFEAIGIDIFPYPVLLLPGYTVLLTYGILRYELMEVNIWARRTITWALILFIPLLISSIPLALFARFGLSGFSGTSFPLLWFLILAAIMLTALIQKPAAALAEKIVYPGSRLNPEIVEAWQRELEGARNWEELSGTAGKLLSQNMNQDLTVKVAPELKEYSAHPPGTILYKDENKWKYSLHGWEEAAPAILHRVNIFASLLVSAALRLESLLALTEKEKALLKERHLTDLGRLSASVAHELRNPLNIISMASASCSEEIKDEIKEQLDRSQKLINDLLSYSGQLKIEPKELHLNEEIEYVLSHYKNEKVTINVDVPEELTLYFDSHRLHQVLFNLMNNACTALKWTEGACINLEASPCKDGLELIFADNGPGMGKELAVDIFRPFVSGGAGGSGLGLAIVQRIMEAHGGKIELNRNKPGHCSFKLYFAECGLS